MWRSLTFMLANSILLLAFMSVQSSDALRILGIFPFNMKSHFVMAEELLKGLAAKGHHVDVYSHFPQKNPVKNYHDFSLVGTIRTLSNNVSFEEVYRSDPTNLLRYWLSSVQEPMCDLLGHPYMQKLLHDPPQDPSYDLFVTELVVINCYIPFGRRLNVPVIAVIPSILVPWHIDGFGTPTNLAAYPTLYSRYIAPMTFFERLDNYILHKQMSWTFHNYNSKQNEYVDKYFGPELPNVYDLYKDVSLVLVNHEVSLSEMMPFPQKIIPVAGLHVVDYNETLLPEVQQWLDESKSGCIYFSFGSYARIETFPRNIIEAFYKAIRNISPVRVLMKIANPEDLPPGLPSNVLTQPWFQQMAVLKHQNIKAFVTHGGLMSMQEAIHFGVPMIGIPLCGDQWINIKACVKRNIGIELSLFEINESTFTNVLNAILTDGKYRESVEKLNRKIKDRPMSVMDTAIFWVEYIHRHGKNALKSPVDDLRWWEASLLDVYAFIGVILFTISLIIILLTVKLIKISLIIYRNTSIKLKEQ